MSTAPSVAIIAILGGLAWAIIGWMADATGVVVIGVLLVLVGLFVMVVRGL